MGTPFLAELRLMSFNFAPDGWAVCNGQLLPINQNQALFSLMGTMYGGNGQTTFALPDLRGRVPIHVGNGFVQGQAGGETSHTVTIQELPEHLHFLQATTNAASTGTPGGAVVLAKSVGANLYAGAGNLVAMNAASVANVGGSQAHQNMQPYLVLTWCIALQGIFPSHS